MPLDPDTEQPSLSAGSSPDPTLPGNRTAADAPSPEATANPPASDVAVEEDFPSWVDPDHTAPPPSFSPPPPTSVPPRGPEVEDEDEGPPEMHKMSFLDHLEELRQIGRASCRERVYVLV